MEATLEPNTVNGATDVRSLHQRLVSQGPDAVRILDVRTPAEHAEVHVQGSRFLPLDRLSEETVREHCDPESPLYILCRSGNRAQQAIKKIEAAGIANAVLIEGGIVAWERAGLPVVRGEGKFMSLERQVRIAAGALVVSGVLLGWLLHPGWFALAGFVGAGLVFAGITDSCAMGLLIARMPWNQRKQD